MLIGHASKCGAMKKVILSVKFAARPGYTAPPPLFHSGGILMNFRENWEVSRRDMHDPYFMAMLSRNQNFMESNFEDYAVPSPGSLLCCRIVALTKWSLLIYLVNVIAVDNLWDSFANLRHDIPTPPSTTGSPWLSLIYIR